MKKRIIIIIICAVLVFAILAGVAIAIIPRNTAPSEENKQTDTVEASEPTESADDNIQTETDSPSQAPVPIPDLEDGYEVYLDTDVVAKLQEMEDSGREDEVNDIIDTLLLLINEFANKEYSVLAIKQIQRFCFAYNTSLADMELDTLCKKLEICIPAVGADKEQLATLILSEFDITITDLDYFFNFEVSA